MKMIESPFIYIDHNGEISQELPDYSATFKRRWPYQKLRVIARNPEPSVVQHSHHDQTDINLIVARFQRDGYFPPNNTNPQYADVTPLQGDLTELHNRSAQQLQEADQFAAQWKPPLEEEHHPQKSTSTSGNQSEER
ncbi:MAG: internal scaffolding protein [Microviridae sp.]|nr:MAG: internal scaffolding protein [Microviridae sp.]